LPTIVREDFDLRKIDGRWLCSQHRKAAVKQAVSPAPRDKLEPLLTELAGLIADMGAEIVTDDDGEEYAEVDEDDRALALGLIDRARALAGKSKR
jgi:hypothetical protein